MEKFKEQIKKDMIEAMKAKDSIRLNTIRSITNSITVAEKNGSGKVVLHTDILSTMSKQRKQSIDAFTNAGKLDLADIESQELVIIESYLPKGMNDEELKKALDNIISGMEQPITQRDMGKIVSEFRTLYPGQDMGKVSGMVKEKL